MCQQLALANRPYIYTYIYIYVCVYTGAEILECHAVCVEKLQNYNANFHPEYKIACVKSFTICNIYV